MHNIRLVLFDLDGTLADTAPDLADALNRALTLHGHATLPHDNIRPAVSHGAAALIRLGFDITPEDKEFEPYHQDLLRFYQKNIHAKTTLFPGMEEVLKRLEQHNIPWGVVTNKPSWLTDPLMESMGLTGRAACIVSGDTTPNSKPHPDPILHACKLAGIHNPEECLYIGDAKRDIEAGRNAGTATLVALFGYLDANDQPETWSADGNIECPEQILEWMNLPPVPQP
ncbi:Similar to phosphoglycolate phosphatase, clustered with ubiquinone biosynthesis SAM-dependent O-methyltransferase [hydrothermal vent metagenome]|uniref:Similar to phosphoglycolate phosphatase, clustered with ubiquinone biosynthesis SAM-dependent O-methyltransferase n=1 Tax=hydrothermal vent metagenome TaxID=652676 RepID=A0A3B1BW29_9ZZZZ